MDESWRELLLYPDRVSAEAVAGLLRSEGIEVRVIMDEPVPGLIRSCALQVPESLLPRAREICGQAPLTEEEWSAYMDEFPPEEGP